MRRICAAVALLCACPAPERGENPVVPDVSLSRVESCEQLESHLEAEATDVLDAEIEARTEQGFLVPTVEPTIRAPRIVGASPFERVVADRDRMFILDSNRLRAVSTEPLQEIASTVVDGEPIGIFPAGDRLFVLTSVGNRTRVALMERSDLSLVRSIDLAGIPDSAVSGDAGLTLVVAGGMYPLPSTAEAIGVVAEDKFRTDAEEQIRDRTLDDWFESDDLGRDCASFWIPSAPVHLGLTRIVSFDRELGASVTSLLGEIAVSIAGSDTILVAAPHRWRLPRPGQVEHSYLFTLDLSGAPKATGGVDGVPQRQATSLEGSIRMITAIDRRESDPINTWGRVTRAHRVELLQVSGAKLVSMSQSPLFAQDQNLRAALLLQDRALMTTIDRIYAFDLSRLDDFAAFPLDAPVDRLGEVEGALIAAVTRGDQLEISVLDPSALDRVFSSRTVTNVFPAADLALSIDPSGLIAVPEIGTPEPGSPPLSTLAAVRVLSVDASGALSSVASIELSPLFADRPEPPHLLYGMFLGGRPLAVSSAGMAALDDTNLTAQSLLFE